MRPAIAGQTELVPVIVPGVDGAAGFTTIVIWLLETVAGIAQAALGVKSSVTISPFCNVDDEKVGVFTAGLPFTFH